MADSFEVGNDLLLSFTGVEALVFPASRGRIPSWVNAFMSFGRVTVPALSLFGLDKCSGSITTGIDSEFVFSLKNAKSLES